jgi:hypothetical protein
MHYFVTYWCNFIAKLYAGPSLSNTGTFPVDLINILMKPVRPTSLCASLPSLLQFVFIQYETRNIQVNIAKDKSHKF